MGFSDGFRLKGRAMTEQEKALYSVVFKLSDNIKDVVYAWINELLRNSQKRQQISPKTRRGK
jgi:hypothetical protein